MNYTNAHCQCLFESDNNLPASRMCFMACPAQHEILEQRKEFEEEYKRQEEQKELLESKRKELEKYINEYVSKRTPEELAVIEAHRNASPYKVGQEPDLTKPVLRLPRKKKKELKKWFKNKKVRLSLLPFVEQPDNKLVKRVYYDLYKLMQKIKVGDFKQSRIC